MSQQTKQYIQYVDELIETLKSTPVDITDLQSIKTDLENKSFLIPVIGEFSSGKSTLLNEVLGSDILPVAITPETEVATELGYSDTPYIVAQDHELKEDKFSINDWDKIKSNSKDYLAFKIYLDNDNVKNLAPFTLVDMPGFNTNLGSFEKSHSHYIQHGDYFIVAVSADKGTLSPELISLLQNIKNDDKFFSVVITKTDLKTETENNEILNHITDLVDTEFGQGFSVKLLQKGQIKTDIQQLLDQNLDQIVQTSFSRPLKDITQSVVGQLNVAKNSLAQDSNKNQSHIEELSEDLQSLERNYKKLQADTQYFDAEKIARLIARQTSKKLLEQADSFADLAGKNDSQITTQIMQISQATIKETLLEELETTHAEVTKKFTTDMSKFTNGFDNSIKHLDISTVHKSPIFGSALGGIFSQLIEFISNILPSPLKGLVQSYRNDHFKINFTQNIVPEIANNLQTALTPLIDNEFRHSTTEIMEKLKSEIEQSKATISQIEADRKAQGQDNKKILSKLIDAQSKIYQLAEKTLYQGN